MNFEHRPPQPAIEPREQTYNIRDLIGSLVRRARIIVAVTVLVTCLGGAATMLQTPVYTATASILINPSREQVLSQEQRLVQEAPTSTVVDSEIEVLRSRPIIARLVAALRLDRDPEWNPALSEGTAVAPGEAESTTPAAPAEAPSYVISAVAGAISAERRGITYVIDVRASSQDPRRAAEMANKLVDLYFAAGYEARVQAGERAGDWLERRLEELRADVSAKEAAAAAYRAEHGLVALSGRSINEEQISEVQASVIAARAELAEREARVRQAEDLARSGESIESIDAAVNSEAISSLRTRESELSRRQAELESRYGEMHPSVQSGRAELYTVRAQIENEIRRIIVNLRNAADVTRNRLRSLEADLARARGDVFTDSAAAARARELDLEVESARAVLNNFSTRYHELDEQGSLESTNARVIAPATPPGAPSSPRVLLNIIGALAVGLVLGLLAGLGAEALDNTLASADDVERQLGVTPLVSIPTLRPAQMRLLAPNERHPAGFLVEKPMSAFAEAFRVLRTSIQYASFHRRTRIVAVTSALPDEGKTTSALCLARIAALSGQRVLIVDCDLRRRSLNALLDIEPLFGLLQVLAGERQWSEVIGEDEATGAHVLPLAVDGFTLRDVFGSEVMEALIDELREAYDLVVLDCPPVLAVAETRVAVSHAEAVIVVSRWGKTPVKAVAAALAQLAPTGANVLGVALNCVNPKAPGRYSYSDPLYYSEARRSYYNA
jgi:capsular exopolysaccharide synthesis family protein